MPYIQVDCCSCLLSCLCAESILATGCLYYSIVRDLLKQRKLLPTRSQPTERLQTGQPSITDLIDGMEEPTTGVPEPAYPAIPDRTFRTSLSSSATGSDRVDSDGMASSNPDEGVTPKIVYRIRAPSFFEDKRYAKEPSPPFRYERKSLSIPFCQPCLSQCLLLGKQMAFNLIRKSLWKMQVALFTIGLLVNKILPTIPDHR